MVGYIRTSPKISRVRPGDHRTSYANRRWREMSAAFLQQYPFCVWCLFSGKVNEGATLSALPGQRNLIVDHIRPHRGDDQLFWDPDNWQTLCKRPCHDQVKQNAERQGLVWQLTLERAAIATNSIDHIAKHREWIPAKLHHVIDSLLIQVSAPGSAEPNGDGGVERCAPYPETRRAAFRYLSQK